MAVYYSQQPPGLSAKINFGWISEAFQLFLAQAGIWIGSLFIFGLIAFAVTLGCEFLFGVFSVIMAHASSGATDPFFIYKMPGYWATVAVAGCVELFLYGGLYRMANAQVRGLPISVGMLFQGGPVFLSILGFQILFSIAATISALLLVLPLFVCMALFAPAYALVADGVPVGEALNRSINAVKQDWFRAGLFFLCLILMSILATVLTCGLGSFAVWPIYMLVLALVYRDMIGMPGVTTDQGLQSYGAQPGVWPPPPGASNIAQNPDPSNPPDAGYANQWPPASPQMPQTEDLSAQTGGVDSAAGAPEQSEEGTSDRPE
jgi:hypothetical protein